MKKFLVLLLSLLMLLSLVGCTKKEEPANEPEVLVEAYPVTVKDQAGREVTIESEPEKLVSGYYISTSTCIALGLKDKLVGIEAKAKSRPIYSLSAPELIDLPNVGSAKEFDLEGCIALEPDLVILPKKLKDAAETISELGIPVLLVNPEDETLLEEMVTLIGTATGKTEEAAKLLAFNDKYQEDLVAKNANVTMPTVYLAGNSDILSTAGKSMYQSTMIELAGGTNVAEDITDTYWAEISLEQLLAYDPEYIVIASEAGYTVEDVLNNSDLAMLTAVKEGKVLKMPSTAESWDSPVPSSVLGSVWLSSKLHPETTSEDFAKEVINEYYETFYGFTYPEQ